LILFPLTFARLVWRITRERPDVVNLHFAGAPTTFVLFAHRLLRFRLVVSLHGDDVEGAYARSRSSQRMLRAALRRAYAVTACSHYLLRQAAAFEPEVSLKGTVIHNGMELPEARSPEPGDYIFAVGRMVKKKGFDTLLRAVAETAVRLELVGDGPEREALHSLALVLGLNGRARFRQVRDRAEMLSLMASSRAVVIPSRQEPFGLVALEAMSFGRPIIASFVGGLPEVLAGADACFVPADEPEELAAAIRSVHARLQDEPDFGSRNRTLAARFSMGAMVDQYAAVYSSVSEK
jgi:glycosyltransferase involved in cell wall biosynthesis